MNLAWALHFTSVAFMTGLIWLVQLVHYPLMDRVQSERFAEFHAAHSRRITWIVGPVMGLQLVSAVLLLPVFAAGFWLTAVVFASTALLSVPAHQRLAAGFDPAMHRRLVLTNWVRTLAWSVHLVLCVRALLL